MPITPTYPGVYVEEIPSGVRTITGVSTSITAFVGYAKKGPLNKAEEILSFSDFERKFGGLTKDSLPGYAVQHFFLNGGQQAYVVRITKDGTAKPASIELENFELDKNVLKISARDPGTWANGLSISIDYQTAHPDSTFNMQVVDPVSGGTESFPGLTMAKNAPRYIESVVNATSSLIRVEVVASVVSDATGTSVSGGAVSISDIDADHRKFMITLDHEDGPQEVTIYDGTDGNLPADMDLLASKIEEAVQANDPGQEPYKSFKCSESSGVLTLTSGESGYGSFVRVTAAGSDDASGVLKLGVANGGRETDAAASIRPAPNGTTSGDLSTFPTFGSDLTLKVTIDGDGPHDVTVFKDGTDQKPTNLKELSQLLQKKIRAVKPNKAGSMNFMGATAKVVGSSIQILSGSSDPNSMIEFENTSADDLKLSKPNACLNVMAYTLGTGKKRGAQADVTSGVDGGLPLADDYKGSEAKKTGIYALLDVDLFNILCLPGVTDFKLTDAQSVLSTAESFCQKRRAFLIIDCPESWLKLDDALDNLSDFDPLRNKNAAMYFPRVKMPDPLDDNRLRTFPPCGIVAGLYARTDSERGVWKAPAGQDAKLRGVSSLVYRLTDKENGLLNPLGLNCMRIFPVIGPIAWGARTLDGADILTSEWKYIPVRRTALFLEESLYRGLKWVVFEPNDEPLWSQIRLNVGAFMHRLFRQGAFQGSTPKEAYLVKCDSETTTQADINLGIVNIVVGFAPLKPAEFVIIKIKQLAGQIQA